MTIIANYVPLEAPDGGPNFYEFGDDVLYEIKIDNNGDGKADITYQFTFTDQGHQPEHVPLQHRPDPVADRQELEPPPDLHRRPRRLPTGKTQTLGTDLPCPPCNIGPLSTPNYAALATAAIHTLAGGGSVFAGQRAEGFYVDLGAIFDLGDPAAVRTGPHDVRSRRTPASAHGRRRQLDQGRQRALDRDPGAEDRR